MAAEKDKNTFGNTMENLFKGMDGFITTKTVVGDAIHLDGTIILPLVDVSFGVGAGAFAGEKKNNSESLRITVVKNSYKFRSLIVFLEFMERLM